jgi:hypothetical protein
MPPRKQHLLFAHRLLPEVAFHDPDNFYKLLGSGSGNRYLQTLWRKAADMIQQPTMEAEGLFGQVLGKRLAIIDFPSPLETPESYFAIMATVPGKKRYGFLPGAPKHAYFTLEIAGKEKNLGKTNLARLDKELYQFDLGPGTAANRDDFVAAVVKELEKNEFDG